MMAIKAKKITPDGRVVTVELPEIETNERDWSARLEDMVGGHIEFVAVLYDRKPATLIVNEGGAVADREINPGGPLPANARATAIYWTATIKGVIGVQFHPLEDPMIHGTAVLIERDKRSL